jgi:SAM-dependent methyltransferase
VGIGFSEFKSQIKTLNNICGGLHPASTLCNTESKILHGKWSKSYYEEPIEEILSFLPKSLKRVLSVGCGWGRTEKLLIDKGAEVTGLPLDSVIGASASNFPINIIYGTLEDAIKSLRGEKFDTIIMTNLLHLIKEPLDIIDDLIKFLCEGGSLLLGGPNFEFLPHLLMRCLKRSDFKNINNYRESGINGLTIRSIRKKLMCLGVNSIKVKWYNSIIPSTLEKKGNAIARNYLARDWALIARLNNN